MSLLTDPSGYLGIRLTMLDALQHYYATPNHDQLDATKKAKLLEVLVKDAAMHNGLLSGRQEIIGNAWAEFIGSRSPEAVAKFVENPDIKHMATTLPKLDLIDTKLDLSTAIGLMHKNWDTLKPLVTGFEDIAQNTGLIDYKGLHGPKDTLSDEIAKYTVAGKDKDLPQHPNMPAASALIKQLFNSHNGQVTDAELGVRSMHVEGEVSWGQAAENLVTAPFKYLDEAISGKGNTFEYGPVTPSEGHLVFDQPAPKTPVIPTDHSQSRQSATGRVAGK